MDRNGKKWNQYFLSFHLSWYFNSRIGPHVSMLSRHEHMSCQKLFHIISCSSLPSINTWTRCWSLYTFSNSCLFLVSWNMIDMESCMKGWMTSETLQRYFSTFTTRLHSLQTLKTQSEHLDVCFSIPGTPWDCQRPVSWFVVLGHSPFLQRHSPLQLNMFEEPSRHDITASLPIPRKCCRDNLMVVTW